MKRLRPKAQLFHHFKGKKRFGARGCAGGHSSAFQASNGPIPLANSTDPITDLKRIFRQGAKREIANGGLVHGCPLNNLAQEMSPLDEKFRQALEKIYFAWRETMAAAFARGIKAGKVRKTFLRRKWRRSSWRRKRAWPSTAKNTQDEALLLQTSQALFDYLDSLKP